MSRRGHSKSPKWIKQRHNAALRLAWVFMGWTELRLVGEEDEKVKIKIAEHMLRFADRWNLKKLGEWKHGSK